MGQGGRPRELAEPVQFIFQIEKKAKIKLRELADDHQISMSQIVRTAIDEYLAGENRSVMVELLEQNQLLRDEVHRLRAVNEAEPEDMSVPFVKELREDGYAKHERQAIVTVCRQVDRHAEALRRMVAAERNGGVDKVPHTESPVKVCWEAKRYVGSWEGLAELVEAETGTEVAP